MSKNYTFLLAPNEDGLGTHAWTTRLAKELIYQRENLKKNTFEVKIIVTTRNQKDFHEQKSLKNPENIISLVKRV